MAENKMTLESQTESSQQIPALLWYSLLKSWMVLLAEARFRIKSTDSRARDTLVHTHTAIVAYTELTVPRQMTPFTSLLRLF